MDKIHKTDAEWRAELDPVQYHVLREAGTERAFAGELTDEKRAGEFLWRRVRNKIVRIGHQIRQRIGLAELYRAGR